MAAASRAESEAEALPGDAPRDPLPALGKDEALRGLAASFKRYYLDDLEGDGEDIHNPCVIETAEEAATLLAEDVLSCVNREGHADFSPLAAHQLRAAACMSADAIRILQRHTGGIANLSFPWSVRDCKEYDPATLAQRWSDAAPQLTHVFLPAPQGEVAVMDLQGFRGEPPPRLVVERDPASALTILLDHRAETPVTKTVDTRSRFRKRAADPLAPGACRFVWMKDGRETRRTKIPGTETLAHHHTVSRTGDWRLDSKRQIAAKDTALNGQARYPAGAPDESPKAIVCADLAIWALCGWRNADMLQDAGEPVQFEDGKHPSLKGMGSAEGIAATIPVAICDVASNWFWEPGGVVCPATAFGAPIADIVAGDRSGQKRYFTIMTPGLPGSGRHDAHALAVRVRVKEKEDGALVYSVRVYDPNSNETWGRIRCDSREDLAKLSLEQFIRPDRFAAYVRPQAPLCLLREFPRQPDSPRLAASYVTPQLRTAPEHLWLAGRSGPDAFASALACVGTADRLPTYEELNPVFHKSSVLTALLHRDDRASLRAFGLAIANASRGTEDERVALGLQCIRDIFANDPGGPAAEAVLDPLIRCVGRVNFVRELLTSGRNERYKTEMIDRYFGARRQQDRRDITAGIAAAFPTDQRLRREWAQRLNVEAPPFVSDDKHQQSVHDEVLAHVPAHIAELIAAYDSPEEVSLAPAGTWTPPEPGVAAQARIDKIEEFCARPGRRVLMVSRGMDETLITVPIRAARLLDDKSRMVIEIDAHDAGRYGLVAKDKLQGASTAVFTYDLSLQQPNIML